ncbi:MAG: zinc ABC transporter substrate-binding protein [Thermoplasmata archaeon]|nr:zinc ABC transporter substrate-binding protein [Thermoplasmata archaeon]
MNRKQKLFLTTVSIIVSCLVIAGAFMTSTRMPSEKLQVVATFYPLYFFASEIGKEKVEVSMLIPENAEVHSWQPGISDMLKMEKARIFIYNGAGLEPWVADFMGAVKNKPVIVDTSQNISLALSPHLQEVLATASGLLSGNCTEISIPSAVPVQPSNTTAYCLVLNQSKNSSASFGLNLSHPCKILVGFAENLDFILENTTRISPDITLNQAELAEHPPVSIAHLYHLDAGTYNVTFNATSDRMHLVLLELEVEGEEHEHGIYDPHIWLDPLLAKVQVRNILAGFKAADPQNASFYEANAEALLKKLDKLHSDFSTGLKNRTRNAIICAHLAFNYLGKRYGFNIYAALGVTADKEPSPSELAQLADLITTLQIRYVFVEPGYPDRYMHTIANQTGAGILVLDAVHGRTGEHANMDYFQIMYENLKNLRIGLGVVN